ncbi:DEAD/DEAH box helicase [Ectothiorhodospira lacustris]|uniref:DEAD/DEAH box helicase n=1 Tax=Ectothiorhodospira lacustris TaxID=2899127 RepID=UPI001EE7E557|nr:DEAD/DEAH box helicase [Ectothiorhodospira lacustris]MCG5499813.1 DEAD/DEAH box helicase [Ectothiorhodospira lacustris]MCG5511054.1 DEAD/DEAH box helicase [Ectothiorhodospira lacustris]MCG5522784.1 DEAD/DEAH box helicase [Ectothiorhodospira lacustris]
MNQVQTNPADFRALGLIEPVLTALNEAGYEVPTPIQAQSIPPLIAGQDLLGQAQTGTGKTAAFALPLLSRLDLSRKDTQILVLAPTRELAIQVAEAFQTYARHLPDFHVMPIYGGQAYSVQLRQLRRGAQVVVGTPGRVMDHMRRGTLNVEGLTALVLDEADEMLRMGFIDDVEWVLEQTPESCQLALFSATMPDVIRRVARKHLKSPQEVRIAAATTTANTIRQRYWRVSGLHKLDALTRLLEHEDFEAMLVFVRTKTETVEIAEKLTARGYAAEALNGDIPQKLRERTVDRLKRAQVDIVVATDVAARGLDVDRISHVVNYDIPHDTESYVHRIGRTGRAGRKGEAILFVAPREQRMLQAIERATRQPIEPMHMPSARDVNERRIDRFKQTITDTLVGEDLSFFQNLVTEYVQEHDADPQEIAAALAHMAQGDSPLLLDERSAPAAPRAIEREREQGGHRDRDAAPRRAPRGARGGEDTGMQSYRVNVGQVHGLKPGNLVGAIANEAGLDNQHIGRINIGPECSTVDLPADLPRELLQHLKQVWVCGQRLNLAPADGREELGGSGGGFRDRRGPGGPGGKPPRSAGPRKPAGRAGKPGMDRPGKPRRRGM